MLVKRVGTALALLALIGGCKGGNGGGGGGSITPPPIGGTPPPPPPPSTAGCSLKERQDWAAAQINEWYLFPETLPANPSPTGYASVDAYIDALTATARAQGRDRYFTYLTSIKEEEAYYSSGSTAGFGVRFSYDENQRRVFIEEAFEGAPALAAGLDRGTEILAIGTTTSNLVTVSDIMASSGAAGVSSALGPGQAGVTRVLRVTDANGVRTVSVTKAEYDLQPVSSRYGVKILNDGGRKVGYVNLRTFITTAEPKLREAFGTFRAEGVTEVIIDFRYNGGGLVRTAELINDLLGANRSTSDVMSLTKFRPSKSQYNETRNFQPQPQSIAPTKIAFIATGASASASELVINAMIPYLGKNVALVGTNTYGKPVGQIGLDKTACDDRLRVVAFATQNKSGQGDYFQGLASKMQSTCLAADDVSRPLGDPLEASTARALDFLAGRSCTPISGGGVTAQSVKGSRELLAPQRPTTAQREVPGLF